MRIFFFSLLLIVSCSTSIQKTSQSYKKLKDFKSLKNLTKKLKLGDERSYVVKLLGEPSYSPTDLQDYYHTEDNYKVHPDTKLRAPYGLILNYDKSGKLQNKDFELLAE